MTSLPDPVSLSVALPLVALVVTALLPSKLRRVSAWFTLLVTIAVLWALFRTLSLIPPAGFFRSGEDLTAVFLGPLFGDAFPAFFAVDLFAAGAAAAAVLVLVLVLVRQVGIAQEIPDAPIFHSAVMAGLAGLVLVMFANGLPAALPGWGLLTISLALIVRLSPEGSPGAGAGMRAIVMLGLGDLLLAAAAGAALSRFLAGAGNVWSDGPGVFTGSPGQEAIFVFGIIGAALCKSAAVPFGTWLAPLWDIPGRQRAPVVLRSSMALVFGVLPAAYLLLRLTWWVYRPYLFPEIAFRLLMVLGVMGVVLGALVSLFTRDFKRLVAFQVVCQTGVALVAIATGTAAGLVGAVFHLFAVGIAVAGLGMVLDDLYSISGNSDIRFLRGLLRRRPLSTAAFALCGAGISGIPLFSGFLSRWLGFKAVIEAGRPGVLLALVFSTILTLAVLARLFHTLLMPASAPSENVAESSPVRSVPPFVLGLVSLAAGIVPLAFGRSRPLFGVTTGEVLSISAIASVPGVLALVALLAGVGVGVLVFLMLTARRLRAANGVGSLPIETAPTTPFAGAAEEPEAPVEPQERRYVEQFGIPGIWEVAQYAWRPLLKAAQNLDSGSLPRYAGYVFIGLWVLLMIVTLGTL